MAAVDPFFHGVLAPADILQLITNEDRQTKPIVPKVLHCLRSFHPLKCPFDFDQA
jgi:hypothetical protein